MMRLGVSEADPSSTLCTRLIGNEELARCKTHFSLCINLSFLRLEEARVVDLSTAVWSQVSTKVDAYCKVDVAQLDSSDRNLEKL